MPLDQVVGVAHKPGVFGTDVDNILNDLRLAGQHNIGVVAVFDALCVVQRL